MPSIASIVGGITNAEFWDAAREASPAFKAHTSKATADLFTSKGYDALLLSDVQALNEFFGLSTRIVFNMLMVSGAKNVFDGSGLVEDFRMEYGEFAQRIAMGKVPTLSPAYNSLVDGESVDQQVVFKSESDSERFLALNDDFQAAITIPETDMKQMFLSDRGVGLFYAGKMKSLENAYIIQKSLNIKECLNAAINSTKWQLQDTQKQRVAEWTDAAPTASELGDLILTIKNIFSDMEASEQTDAYNAGQYPSVYSAEDHVILMRAGLKNRISLELELGAFNPEKLSLASKIVEVKDFGGLVPYMLSGTTHVAQQRVYDKFGRGVGYLPASGTVNGYATKRSDGKWIVSYTSGGVTADTTINEGKPDGWDDPNGDVIAIIAQKGVIARLVQNDYSVSPAPRNARGLYTTYYANAPHNGLDYDPYYNLILILKPEASNT